MRGIAGSAIAAPLPHHRPGGLARPAAVERSWTHALPEPLDAFERSVVFAMEEAARMGGDRMTHTRSAA